MTPKDQRRKIVEGLSETSLGEILLAPRMPTRRTVLKWMREEADFAAQCLDARRDRAETLLDLHQGELLRATDRDESSVAQAKVRHLEWYLERMLPSTYGRRTMRVEVTDRVSYTTILAEARKRANIIDAPKELPENIQ